jgi:phasin family protein
MAETKRMTEEAKRMGEEFQEQSRRVGREYQEHAERVGREYQRAAESGLEAVSQSFGEVNKGFQAIAAEMTGYSKQTFEDVVEAWQQLLRARSLTDMVDVQTRYAQRAIDTHVSQLSKLTELYLDLTRKASRPLEESARRSS